MDNQEIDLTSLAEAGIFMTLGTLFLLAAATVCYFTEGTIWLFWLPLALGAATLSMFGVTAYGLGLTAAIIGIRRLKGDRNAS